MKNIGFAVQFLEHQCRRWPTKSRMQETLQRVRGACLLRVLYRGALDRQRPAIRPPPLVSNKCVSLTMWEGSKILARLKFGWESSQAQTQHSVPPEFDSVRSTCLKRGLIKNHDCAAHLADESSSDVGNQSNPMVLLSARECPRVSSPNRHRSPLCECFWEPTNSHSFHPSRCSPSLRHPLSAVPSRFAEDEDGTAAWLVCAGQTGLFLQLIFGANVIGIAGNQSAEDLVMSRARARFTNLLPCFL